MSNEFKQAPKVDPNDYKKAMDSIVGEEKFQRNFPNFPVGEIDLPSDFDFGSVTPAEVKRAESILAYENEEPSFIQNTMALPRTLWYGARQGAERIGSDLSEATSFIAKPLSAYTGGDFERASRKMGDESERRRVEFGTYEDAYGIGGTLGKFLGDVSEGVVHSSPVVLGGMMGLGLPGAAATAAFQSGIGTAREARESYMFEGMPEDEARKASVVPGLSAAAITGVLTSAFGLTGLESVLRKTGIAGTKNQVVEVLRQAGFEGIEESIDELLQSAVAWKTFDPDMTLIDAISSSLWAGAVGAGSSTAFTIPKAFHDRSKGNLSAERIEPEFSFDESEGGTTEIMTPMDFDTMETSNEDVVLPNDGRKVEESQDPLSSMDEVAMELALDEDIADQEAEMVAAEERKSEQPELDLKTSAEPSAEAVEDVKANTSEFTSSALATEVNDFNSQVNSFKQQLREEFPDSPPMLESIDIISPQEINETINEAYSKSTDLYNRTEEVFKEVLDTKTKAKREQLIDALNIINVRRLQQKEQQEEEELKTRPTKSVTNRKIGELNEQITEDESIEEISEYLSAEDAASNLPDDSIRLAARRDSPIMKSFTSELLKASTEETTKPVEKLFNSFLESKGLSDWPGEQITPFKSSNTIRARLLRRSVKDLYGSGIDILSEDWFSNTIKDLGIKSKDTKKLRSQLLQDIGFLEFYVTQKARESGQFSVDRIISGKNAILITPEKGLSAGQVFYSYAKTKMASESFATKMGEVVDSVVSAFPQLTQSMTSVTELSPIQGVYGFTSPNLEADRVDVAVTGSLDLGAMIRNLSHEMSHALDLTFLGLPKGDSARTAWSNLTRLSKRLTYEQRQQILRPLFKSAGLRGEKLELKISNGSISDTEFKASLTEGLTHDMMFNDGKGIDDVAKFGPANLFKPFMWLADKVHMVFSALSEWIGLGSLGLSPYQKNKDLEKAVRLIKKNFPKVVKTKDAVLNAKKDYDEYVNSHNPSYALVNDAERMSYLKNIETQSPAEFRITSSGYNTRLAGMKMFGDIPYVSWIMNGLVGSGWIKGLANPQLIKQMEGNEFLAEGIDAMFSVSQNATFLSNTQSNLYTRTYTKDGEWIFDPSASYIDRINKSKKLRGDKGSDGLFTRIGLAFNPTEDNPEGIAPTISNVRAWLEDNKVNLNEQDFADLYTHLVNSSEAYKMQGRQRVKSAYKMLHSLVYIAYRRRAPSAPRDRLKAMADQTYNLLISGRKQEIASIYEQLPDSSVTGFQSFLNAYSGILGNVKQMEAMFNRTKFYIPEIRSGRFLVMYGAKKDGKVKVPEGFDSFNQAEEFVNSLYKKGYSRDDVRLIDKSVYEDGFITIGDEIAESIERRMFDQVEQFIGTEKFQEFSRFYTPLESTMNFMASRMGGAARDTLLKKKRTPGYETLDLFYSERHSRERINWNMSKSDARLKMTIALMEPELAENKEQYEYLKQMSENLLGRQYDEFSKLKSGIFAYFMLFRVATAVVESTQLMTVAAPELQRYGAGFGQSYKHIMNGLQAVIKRAVYSDNIKNDAINNKNFTRMDQFNDPVALGVLKYLSLSGTLGFTGNLSTFLAQGEAFDLNNVKRRMYNQSPIKRGTAFVQDTMMNIVKFGQDAYSIALNIVRESSAYAALDFAMNNREEIARQYGEFNTDTVTRFVLDFDRSTNFTGGKATRGVYSQAAFGNNPYTAPIYGTAMILRTFVTSMPTWYLRTAYNSIKNYNKGDYKKSRREFAALAQSIGTFWVLAGIPMGTPGFMFLMSLLQDILGDEYDIKSWFQDKTKETLEPATRSLNWVQEEMLGSQFLNLGEAALYGLPTALTPFDLSNRLNVGGIMGIGDQGEGLLKSSIWGVSGSLFENFAKATRHAIKAAQSETIEGARDQLLQGFDDISPVALKDIFRIDGSNYYNSRGELLVDDLSGLEQIGVYADLPLKRINRLNENKWREIKSSRQHRKSMSSWYDEAVSLVESGNIDKLEEHIYRRAQMDEHFNNDTALNSSLRTIFDRLLKKEMPHDPRFNAIGGKRTSDLRSQQLQEVPVKPTMSKMEILQKEYQFINTVRAQLGKEPTFPGKSRIQEAQEVSQIMQSNPYMTYDEAKMLRKQSR